MATNFQLIDAAMVQELLSISDCIALMQRTQTALSRGDIRIPLRSSIELEDDNALLVMPGNAGPVFGAKLLSLYPHNAPLPAIQGVIVLFDAAQGAPLAAVEAASVTAIRTAAASAAATRALAREDARTLTLLGYGVQAHSHLKAMLAVRDIRHVHVWGPDATRAREFAESARENYKIPVEPVADAAVAAGLADIVCAVSRATAPIIRGELLKPGCHVNLVGAHAPDSREADAATIARARVFTEITEFALAEAGDLQLAFAETELTQAHICGEIGQVFAGDIAGRTATNDITLYKNLGNVAQDLAAASFVVARAAEPA